MNIKGLLLLCITPIALVAPALAHACDTTFRSYSAVGDGITDDTAAVRAAFASGCNVDGENYAYAVRGTMEIQGDITLTNAKFIQKAVGENLRTLFKLGGTINMKHIAVDRGSEQRNGNIQESAGIFLSNIANSELDDIEITGNGYGNGLWLIYSSNVILNKVYVHDLVWSTPSPPQYEQVIGIRIEQSTDVDILYPRIVNILGETGDDVYRSYQSDGMTLTGTARSYVLSAAIENVGEGIDFTGGSGNTNFEVAHSSVFDAHSFGFKFANSAVDGIVRDSVAVRSGWAGFVFSGPSENNLTHKTSNIIVDNCQAVNTGHNRAWLSNTVSGFFIMRDNVIDVDFPKNITIKNSTSTNDVEHAGIKKYGFYSQTAGNFLSNTDSYGHTIEGSRGF